MSRWRWLRTPGPGLILILGLCLLGGCVSNERRGDQVAYHHSVWAGWVVMVFGLAVMPLGVLLRSKAKRPWGYGLAIIGPVLLITKAPGLFLDRTEVTADGFVVRQGPLWNRAFHSIRFEDLQALRQRTELPAANRFGRQTTQAWLDCAPRNGPTLSIAAGPVLASATYEITLRAQARGVPVTRTNPALPPRPRANPPWPR